MSLSIAAEVNSMASMEALFHSDAGYVIAAVGCGPAAESGHIGREIRQGRLKAARIRDPDVKRTLVVGTAASVTSRVDVVRKAAVRVLRGLTRVRTRRCLELSAADQGCCISSSSRVVVSNGESAVSSPASRPVQTVPAEIARVSALQQAHQWEMKATTAAERKDRLKKLRAAVEAPRRPDRGSGEARHAQAWSTRSR